MLPKHSYVLSFSVAVVTVLKVQREAASDYLASTAAPAEWFTSHCSALVYCFQKSHQCEHQSATGTPLRTQSIHLHAAQPWPVLCCLKNTTCTMCAHICVLCVIQCILIIIILKQILKWSTYSIFKNREEYHRTWLRQLKHSSHHHDKIRSRCVCVCYQLQIY